MAWIFIFILISAIFAGFLPKFFSHREKMQKHKLKELELNNKMLELEIEKQNIQLKLLEAENRKYDMLINESDTKN